MFLLLNPPFLLNLQAAALYAQASDFNKTARFYYMKAEDAYFLANAQASPIQQWLPPHFQRAFFMHFPSRFLSAHMLLVLIYDMLYSALKPYFLIVC